MDKGVQEEAIRKDANKEVVESCDRDEERVCTIKRKGIPTVERGERGGKRICERTIEERIYPAIKVTTNSASILCREERQEETDGARLQVSQQVDDQKQLSASFDIQCLEKHWDEENIYEDGFKVGV